ncbi:hypothetical protein EYF80_062530 [Liparis tanakae]|uniref:Uncharacterized protein n=1 Tax=Liparis tanakae TaxID=230148 RepID=A0A4Z2EEM5_9TELE|nr:hypothetical protein EYF80_062530 [Liparis tanakae]
MWSRRHNVQTALGCVSARPWSEETERSKNETLLSPRQQASNISSEKQHQDASALKSQAYETPIGQLPPSFILDCRSAGLKLELEQGGPQGARPEPSLRNHRSKIS